MDANLSSEYCTYIPNIIKLGPAIELELKRDEGHLAVLNKNLSDLAEGSERYLVLTRRCRLLVRIIKCHSIAQKAVDRLGKVYTAYKQASATSARAAAKLKAKIDKLTSVLRKVKDAVRKWRNALAETGNAVTFNKAVYTLVLSSEKQQAKGSSIQETESRAAGFDSTNPNAKGKNDAAGRDVLIGNVKYRKKTRMVQPKQEWRSSIIEAGMRGREQGRLPQITINRKVNTACNNHTAGHFAGPRQPVVAVWKGGLSHNNASVIAKEDPNFYSNSSFKHYNGARDWSLNTYDNVPKHHGFTNSSYARLFPYVINLSLPTVKTDAYPFYRTPDSLHKTYNASPFYKSTTDTSEEGRILRHPSKTNYRRKLSPINLKAGAETKDLKLALGEASVYQMPSNLP